MFILLLAIVIIIIIIIIVIIIICHYFFRVERNNNYIYSHLGIRLMKDGTRSYTIYIRSNSEKYGYRGSTF